MAGSMSGRNVIITGASRGLGRALATTFWKSGASLLLVSRSGQALSELRAELLENASGEQDVTVLASDLRRESSVGAIVAEAERRWSRVHVLINNAAILGPIGPAWESAPSAWAETIRVNLLAPIELSSAVAPWMRRQGRGKIINLSGGGATGPRPGFAAYATAKTGLVRFSEILAEELRAANVQVNCVAPGIMGTDLAQAVIDAGPAVAGEREYTQALAAREAGSAGLERAVELCVFLASPASDGITGKLLSAVWDPWDRLDRYPGRLQDGDMYTLRRVVPRDRDADRD